MLSFVSVDRRNAGSASNSLDNGKLSQRGSVYKKVPCCLVDCSKNSNTGALNCSQIAVIIIGFFFNKTLSIFNILLTWTGILYSPGNGASLAQFLVD